MYLPAPTEPVPQSSYRHFPIVDADCLLLYFLPQFMFLLLCRYYPVACFTTHSTVKPAFRRRCFSAIVNESIEIQMY
eukprot:gene2339-4550_t